MEREGCEGSNSKHPLQWKEEKEGVKLQLPSRVVRGIKQGIKLQLPSRVERGIKQGVKL